MPWLSKADAASAMRISARTLARRVTQGIVKTKKEGRRVLIFVPEDQVYSADPKREAPSRELVETAEHLTNTGRQLIEVAAAATVQRKHDADLVSTAVTSIRETRMLLEHDARTAREEAERARSAEQRTHRAAYRIVAFAATIVMVVLVGIATITSRYQSAAASHGEEVRRLREAVTSIATRYEGDSQAHKTAVQAQRVAEAATGAMQAQREADAETIAQLRSRISARTAMSASLEAQNAAHIEMQATLRGRVAELTTRIAGMQIEHDQLVCERDDVSLHRDRLANKLDELQQHIATAEEPLALKNLIDSAWEDRDRRPRETSYQASARIDNGAPR